MSAKSLPKPRFRWWRGSRQASWDLVLPTMGLVFLFLEVSPRPVFDLSLESARILLQFPLLAVVFLAAWEKRFIPAMALGGCLGLLQCLPGVLTVIQAGEPLDGLFPALAWIVLMLSYFHPSRRGVYLGNTYAKETHP